MTHCLHTGPQLKLGHENWLQTLLHQHCIWRLWPQNLVTPRWLLYLEFFNGNTSYVEQHNLNKWISSKRATGQADCKYAPTAFPRWSQILIERGQKGGGRWHFSDAHGNPHPPPPTVPPLSMYPCIPSGACFTRNGVWGWKTHSWRKNGNGWAKQDTSELYNPEGEDKSMHLQRCK